MRVLVFFAVGLVAAGAALAAPSGRITATSIGGVGLGATRSAYEQALHERAFVSTLPQHRTRLSFSRAEIIVTLDRAGKGIAVETAASEYRTSAGGHACGDAAVMLRQYGKQLVPARNRAGTLAGYRAGRLAFTVRLGRIGAVMVAAPSVAMQDLVNAPQCGSGEEGQ